MAKPLFDVVADEPEFCAARGNTGSDIVVFALAVTLLPADPDGPVRAPGESSRAPAGPSARAPGWRDGDLAVVLPGGRAIAVEPGVADGFVDSVSAEGGRLAVAGWATAGDHSGPVDNVLLFAGGRLVHATAPGGQRPDLTEQFGAQVQPAGYEFSGIGNAESVSGKDLRVFAVVAGRASEIRAP